MARILKVLTALVGWRWTPAIALVTSSLAFVLIAVAVVPTNISLPGSKSQSLESGDAVNVISDAPPRTERPTTTPPRRVTAPTPVAPPPTPVIAPPQEERRAEPPPPPAPPPPPPTPANEDEEQTQAAPAPTPGPPSSRFMATPLRFLNQAAAKPGGAPGAPTGEAAPGPAPNPDDER